MICHILNGDGLHSQFVEAKLDGEPLVFREALIEGPIGESERDLFWRSRAEYLERTYQASKEEYLNDFVGGIRRLSGSGPSDEVNLWFGDDLFCQVNMWFCLGVLSECGARLFRVFPAGIDFGLESADDLKRAFSGRVRLTDDDIALGSDLWRAFVSRDAGRFAKLAERESGAFRRFPEVCRAAADIGSRPLETIRTIVSEIGADFPAVFREFSKREPIFGFGDVQVRQLLASV